jgi:transposase-like protein
MNKTTCPKCSADLKEVWVSFFNSKKKAQSFQCPKCDFFKFDQKSGSSVVDELKEQSLKITQKIVKLSGERLGLYLNKHVVSSLNLKKGQEIEVSVPDKKHILLEIA